MARSGPSWSSVASSRGSWNANGSEPRTPLKPAPEQTDTNCSSHARAPSSDKTLRLYGGFWHDLLHEPGLAQVSSEIADWIEKHLTP
jgi:alpha-beta hydrolase superfamily lysophospholipase